MNQFLNVLAFHIFIISISIIGSLLGKKLAKKQLFEIKHGSNFLATLLISVPLFLLVPETSLLFSMSIAGIIVGIVGLVINFLLFILNKTRNELYQKIFEWFRKMKMF